MSSQNELKQNTNFLILVYMLVNSDRFIDCRNRPYIHTDDKEGLKGYPGYTYCPDFMYPFLFNLRSYIRELYDHKIVEEIIHRRIYSLDLNDNEHPSTNTLIIKQNSKSFDLKLLDNTLYNVHIQDESDYLEYEYDYFLKINRSNAKKFIRDYLLDLKNDEFNHKPFNTQLRHLCQQIEDRIKNCKENNLVLKNSTILINKDGEIENVEPLIFYLEEKKCIDIKFFFKDGFQAEILDNFYKKYITPLSEEIIFSLDFIDKQELTVNKKYVLSFHKTSSEVSKFLNHIFNECKRENLNKVTNSFKIEIPKKMIYDSKSNILNKMNFKKGKTLRNLFFPNTTTNNVVYFRKEVRKKDLELLNITKREVCSELETLSKRQIQGNVR